MATRNIERFKQFEWFKRFEMVEVVRCVLCAMRYERCALYIDKTLKWTGDEFSFFLGKRLKNYWYIFFWLLSDKYRNVILMSKSVTQDGMRWQGMGWIMSIETNFQMICVEHSLFKLYFELSKCLQHLLFNQRNLKYSKVHCKKS